MSGKTVPPGQTIRTPATPARASLPRGQVVVLLAMASWGVVISLALVVTTLFGLLSGNA